MGKLRLHQEVGLHNKFHVVVTDVRTGEIKQEALAYNLILDQAFDKILNGLNAYIQNSTYHPPYSQMRPDSYQSDGVDKRYGGYIHIGEGTGGLSAARTQLFDFYKGFYGSHYASAWDAENQTGYYTIKVVILPGEQYPGPITEIGLASYTTADSLSTHALLEDSEGNAISITPGTYDQLTLYATNYIKLSHSLSGGKVGFVGGPLSQNYFKRVFVDNIPMVSNNTNRFIVSLGNSLASISPSNPVVVSSIVTKRFAYNSGIATFDKTLKRIVFDGIRFDAAQGNNSKGVREIGLTWHEYPVFRSVLPIPGVWTGKDIEDEEVDTGDGNTKVFNLKWPDIVYESEKIYVQGRSPELQARGTDYTMSDPETSEITFAVAPASGAAITANYRVDYIPKDENHVLDISFTLSFKDANAE